MYKPLRMPWEAKKVPMAADLVVYCWQVWRQVFLELERCSTWETHSVGVTRPDDRMLSAI